VFFIQTTLALESRLIKVPRNVMKKIVILYILP